MRGCHKLEGLLFVDDLDAMLVVAGRRPVADGGKVAVHRWVCGCSGETMRKDSNAKGLLAWVVSMLCAK